MRPRNGLRRRLVALAATVLLGLGGWVALSVVDHEARLAAAEAQQTLLKEWLARVEGKLDAVLRAPRP